MRLSTDKNKVTDWNKLRVEREATERQEAALIDQEQEAFKKAQHKTIEECFKSAHMTHSKQWSEILSSVFSKYACKDFTQIKSEQRRFMMLEMNSNWHILRSQFSKKVNAEMNVLTVANFLLTALSCESALNHLGKWIDVNEDHFRERTSKEKSLQRKALKVWTEISVYKHLVKQSQKEI